MRGLIGYLLSKTLKGEKQRQDKYHNDTENQLQG